jgi:hypothetical protein
VPSHRAKPLMPYSYELIMPHNDKLIMSYDIEHILLH